MYPFIEVGGVLDRKGTRTIDRKYNPISTTVNGMNSVNIWPD